MTRLFFLAVAIGAMLPHIFMGAPVRAEDPTSGETILDEAIHRDFQSRSLQIPQGFMTVIPLNFVPSIATVGDPGVLGLNVVEGGVNPQINLVGVAPGATNIVVFDKKHQPRIVMEVTVDPPTYGSADKVTVYRLTTVEDNVCTAGQCRKIK